VGHFGSFDHVQIENLVLPARSLLSHLLQSCFPKALFPFRFPNRVHRRSRISKVFQTFRKRVSLDRLAPSALGRDLLSPAEVIMDSPLGHHPEPMLKRPLAWIVLQTLNALADRNHGLLHDILSFRISQPSPHGVEVK